MFNRFRQNNYMDMVFCLYKAYKIYNNDNGLAHTRQNNLFNMLKLKYVYSCVNLQPSFNVALKRHFFVERMNIGFF